MSETISEDDAAAGRRFVKFYPRGLERIRALLDFKGGPTVGKLWLLLVEQAGHDNAVVATFDVLADMLGVNERSVRRAVAVLSEGGAIVVAKMGSANAYILNDDEVWKSYEEHHRFCGFRAKAIVGFKENGALRARLSHLSAQRSLPLGGRDADL